MSRKSNVCTKCNTRIPKNTPILICSQCDEIKHPKCMKLSKTDAQHLIDSHYPWTCCECIADVLPINACLISKKPPVIGPKFKVQCSSCAGWSYSPGNVKTCNWCDGHVHVNCLINELGCIKCCEAMIPGYYVNPYQLLDDYSQIHNIFVNPYDRENFVNTIGGLIDEEQSMEYWNEISEIIVGCDYKQQKHVNTSRHNELKVFSLNVRSLTKTIDHFREELLTYSKYDVLTFNETNLIQEKLANGINDVLLEGFHEPILQNPTRSSGRGGGLAIYINKRVCDSENIEQFTPKFNTNSGNVNSGEFMLVKIHNCKGFNKTKIIVNTYRSPSKDPEKFISLIDSLMYSLERHSKKHIIFAGDFNMDLINYNKNTNCQNLLDTMSKYGFFQLVARPTRITSHSSTIIDHVYSNFVQHTLSCNVLTVDVSDHLATLTTIALGDFCFDANNTRSKIPDRNKCDTRVFNDANHLKFKDCIESETWEEITSDMNADEQYATFNRLYCKHYETAYPNRSKQDRRKNERVNPKPFMLPWLEDACSRKNSLFHKSVNDPSEKNIVAYNKMKAFCEKHVGMAKDKYYKNYFEKYHDSSKKTVANDKQTSREKNKE